MFNWKRKKKDTKDTEIEYSFIWYKRMETRKGKTFFTQPFRTKVKAKTYRLITDKLYSQNSSDLDTQMY